METTAASEQITVTVEFQNGVEILFDNVSKYDVKLEQRLPSGDKPTAGYLIQYLCKNLMKDPRKDMFVLSDGHLRPGILVLINDADWELDGEDKYELADGDNVLFVSTLHGG